MKTQKDILKYDLRQALRESIEDLNDAEVKACLDDGADPNEVDPVNRQTPLTLAARYHFEEMLPVVRLLIAAGADVNQRDKNRALPLVLAASRDCLGIMQLLLDAGARVDGFDDEDREMLGSHFDNDAMRYLKAVMEKAELSKVPSKRTDDCGLGM